MSASLAAAPALGRAEPSGHIRFGAYEIQPGARALMRHGVGVAIGGRAFDVLMTLARAPGRIVAKQDLMRRVWPATIVEEANLRAQLRYLRLALGGDFWRVKTVPGRGYLLNVADDPSEYAGNDETSPVPPSAPVVIIDASPEQARALRGLCAQATDEAEPRQCARMRILDGDDAQQGLAALADHLRAQAGAAALGLDRFGRASSAMVMVWRGPAAG